MSFVLLLGLLVFPTPASAEVFDKITATSGDGWDVTFHPTNQNYAFFVHHRGTQFGCLYRLDPDGDGPKQQGDPCFTNSYSKNILGSGAGQKSSAWVTSDGNTAYVPLNSAQIAVIDISDEDPDNWSRSGYVSFSASAQYHSNSIMVDDVLWATASTGVLKYDTTTQTASIYSKTMWSNYAPVYYADGKIWSVSNASQLVCVDVSADAFCTHGNFVDGVGGQFQTRNALVEYRNPDGSFGGFCSMSTCIKADGSVDTDGDMTNPISSIPGSYGSWTSYGIYYVTDQHQVILHQPLSTTQTYSCWDFTTQGSCAGFSSSTQSNPSNTYTIVQDAWNSNCYWSNADSRVIGSWEFSNGNGFAASDGACDITYVPLTVTLTYDPQGGSGEPDDQTGDESSDVTLSATIPTLPGYTFTGWNTEADGSGTDYAAEATYTLPNSGTDTLYAQWQINTVGLTYDPQGGSGQPGDQSDDAASDVTVSSTEPTRDGYTFTGWNTVANGTGTSYTGGSTYRLPNSGTDTLYAQWTPVASSETPGTTIPTENTIPTETTVPSGSVGLVYDAQGGTGAPGDETGGASSDVTVSSTEPTREGYTFVGWNTEPDGSGTTYTAEDIVTLPLTGVTRLYAMWKPVTDSDSPSQQLPSTGSSSTTELFVLAAALGALLALMLRRRTT
ncbi:MAG: InlB B-repeat-containing protein [Ilumatobacteraceae bacterium]